MTSEDIYNADPPSCPPLEELAQFLRGELAENEANDIRHHSAYCRDCRETLALMDSTPANIWSSEEVEDSFRRALKAIY